jgi:tetratricopeptide (TPR) repeat protein
MRGAPATAAPSMAPPSAPATASTSGANEAQRFADWLFDRGDYYRAIGEYERVIFLSGDETGWARLQIGRAYAAGGRHEQAILDLRAVEDGSPSPSLRADALFEQGRTRYAAAEYQRAAVLLERYARAPEGGPGRGHAQLLRGLALLHDPRGLAAARSAFADAERDPAFADAAATLARATDEVAASPRRSALTAGLLSAAVPGLGHAYAGDAWAGAGALALNAAFAWATWEAFDGGRPGLGLVLGAATSIWYGGAIFGAVAEVMRFNRDVRAERLEAAEARFRWVLEAAPLPGGGAAGVRGRF